MNKPTILNIHVGLPKTFGTANAADPMDRPWSSGIYKESVETPVWLGKTNLTGDGQADLKNHGGPEKAVLVYAHEHYHAWKQELNLEDFSSGAFGENFTVQGQTEKSVCIGDTYQIGEAVAQVSQPRQPCWKPARRWRIKDLAVRMQETGRTGWYLRVLKEGFVVCGNEVMLMERPFPEWTIAVCNDIMHNQKHDREAAASLAACPLLAERWVHTLSKRARTGENPDINKRVIGPNR